MTEAKTRLGLGLVAHDRLKPALAEWAQAHREILTRHRLFATGTTGRLLLEAMPGAEIARVESGPLGGDLQIGAAIVEGRIDALIFLVDPLTPQPHDVDVKALIRICTLYGAPLALNLPTAEALLAADWFARPELLRRAPNPFAESYKAREIAAPPPPASGARAMTFAAAWEAAGRDADRLKRLHLRQLFQQDPERFARLSRRSGDLLVDFSKEKLDAGALKSLLALAEAADVAGKREAMFRGEPINLTEGRAVLHVAARDPSGAYDAPGFAEVAPTLDRFLAFAEAVRSGDCAPPTGGRFTDVVNIGIGGSDLGPAMAVRALAPCHDGPRVHFVSNVDGAHLTDTLKGLDPAHTLVLIASKTFTTQETMTNARSARAWLAAKLGEAGAGAHLAAVSTNLGETAKFGVEDSRVFGFWDWIGGRYSVWTAIGLPLAVAVGAENFRAFLAGAKAMDDHFRSAPAAENLPLLMGLVGIWRRNFMGASSVAVIPYDERLGRLPAYLQQLTMESNGKRVTRGGEAVTLATCPVVWGEAGTNAQHSFFQLLHQGTDVIPVDFLAAAQAHEILGDHHAKLLANCFAQSQALAFGKLPGEVAAEMRARGLPESEIARLTPHRSFPGDRPSTTLLYPLLDPERLGGLIALYEHKTFVEAAIWDVNAYDQWGVELGKELAAKLLPGVEKGEAPAGADSSTAGLVAAAAVLRKTHQGV